MTDSVALAHLEILQAGRLALERARDRGEIREIKRIGDVAAAAREAAERSAVAQGLPARVEDRMVLARVAAQLSEKSKMEEAA